MIRRHPIHYIIESPRGRPKLIILRDAILTLFVWAMYFYFMRDFFFFCGDFFMYAIRGFQNIEAYPSLKILGTIANYLGVSLVLMILFLAWSGYNAVRFRNKTRRKFQPPVGAQELGDAYHAGAKAVGMWQKARVMVMHHDRQGHLTDVLIQE
jgi:poly-beta-1,6-N-acetyl-D-glucosamine biosynthesis protein PgaD